MSCGIGGKNSELLIFQQAPGAAFLPLTSKETRVSFDHGRPFAILDRSPRRNIVCRIASSRLVVRFWIPLSWRLAMYSLIRAVMMFDTGTASNIGRRLFQAIVVGLRLCRYGSGNRRFGAAVGTDNSSLGHTAALADFHLRNC